MAKADMKPRPLRAQPFRGRDLLDGVYGIADQYAMVRKFCKCGASELFVDERVVPYCPACQPARILECFVFETDDELGPESPIVKMKGDEFQFFANRWWELNRSGERIRMVDSFRKAAELDRRAHRLPKPLPEMRGSKPQFSEFYLTRDGRLRLRKSYSAPECYCASEEDHTTWAHDLPSFCPEHGNACSTCGGSHI